ncbi:hypothetical protein BHM03_00022082 [Ensete ventricosum]|nr:hypothetical protein BHM03_00022082 [Ensete ventricosum]
MIIEALVVGKREDHKRPRAEKSQEQPTETMRRQPDRPKPSYPRPPPPLLNSTRTKIFLQIREKGLLRMPNPLKGPRELQDWANFGQFMSASVLASSCRLQSWPVMPTSVSASHTDFNFGQFIPTSISTNLVDKFRPIMSTSVSASIADKF